MRCVPRILTARNAQMGGPLNADDVADLAQDALLRLWKKLGTFAGRSSLEAWAYGFCSLELMNELRRAQRRPRGLPVEAGAEVEPAAPSVDLDAGLMREEGEAWLANLPERERQIVRLRHFEGLEATQIASSIGISVSSVKTHYYRALEKLRRWIPDPDAPSADKERG
ncbi:ECF RNA polymerase sigma factor SigG [Planctomycetes bacterium Pla86]|uniref:ECF RNA polymerase sigma factor SigG n=2 Tax=Engelhardtia mirabilis TaxID=2528011 RepID=A0A518BSA8_9BACT|nr:ECF RNA polymerase sigma factor SigG [Planctomycetes bacterium Pla133]QDV04180.1 ECF RNA polymerase sigma factor SigG [Planctomycetes bacterium Pla86]